MNIEHLRYLVTIADCKSINKASEQLLLKQQYLSTLVKNLEKQFGTQLFERNYRGITLTADGDYLIGQIRDLIAMNDRLMLPYLYPSNQYHRNDEDTLQIYSIPQVSSTTLNKTIGEFRHLFPKVKLKVSFKSSADIIESIVNEPLSLGIITSTLSPDVIRTQLPPDVSIFLIRVSEMMALASPQNKDAQTYDAISCTELLGKELIVYTVEDVKQSPLYCILSPHGEPNIKYVVESTSLLFDLLHNSNYYTIAERFVGERENLLTIPLKDHSSLYALIVANDQGLQSFAIKSFLNIMLHLNNQPTI